MKRQGSNINTIKAENNSLILNLIRRAPISRAEICKLTGLSKSSVTTITKQLIEEGQLIEIGTENTSFGRHPILLDIVSDYRFAMGINLTRTEVSVCIVNLKLEAIDSESRAVTDFSTAEALFDWCYEKGCSLLLKNGIDIGLCIGIGVAAPGPLDYKKGVILNPPNFPLFNSFDLKGYFRGKTDMPVFLNNAPVLMAMYEQLKRSPEIKNYIFISVDSGIGSAIVQNGSIYTGSAGFSGEIGHTTVNIDGPLCSCGNTGCLEEYVTQKAIERNFNISSFNSMIDAAYNGEKNAELMVRKTAKYFAGGIINAVNLLDLEAVIIYGELNYRHRLLFSALQEELDIRCIISKAHRVMVMPSQIVEKDTAVYTTAKIIHKYFRQML